MIKSVSTHHQNRISDSVQLRIDELDQMLYPLLRSGYSLVHHPEIAFELPSQGEPLIDCGEVRAKAWCPDCQTFKHELLNYCSRSECPTCSLNTAAKAAIRITERMQSYLELLVDHKKNARLSHVTFSQHPDDYSDFKSMRKRLYQVMKRAGVRGACVIFHPFRFRDFEGNEVPWKHCSLNPNAEGPVIDSIRLYSPHWHTIGTGWLIPSDEFEERTGWIYKKHGTLDSRDDVFYCASYLVSHMGINDAVRSITYMGECSYNRMVIESEWVDQEPVLCPDCGCQLILHYNQHVDIDRHPDGYCEPWHRKVIKREYRLKVTD